MKKRIIQMIIAVLLFSVAPFMTTQASASTGNEIVNYAKSLSGIAYKYGGSTPSGFDCSGFTSYVYKKFDVNLPRTAASQYGAGTAVSKSNLQQGDLVFFNNLGAGISHVGIYVGNSNFISATSSKGIATVSINDSYWGKYYVGAKRVVNEETTPVATSEPMSDVYSDVPLSHPALNAILTLSQDGVINGYKNSTFKPENSITRGQTAAMLNRVLNLNANHPVQFTDVAKSNDFAADIAAMNEVGILKGYSNGTFGIYETLTRAQLAVIVDRAFELQEKADAQVRAASIYHDVPSSYWAHDAIIALKSIDQTKVFQTANFKLNEDASRAEFSAAIYSATK
ncbi:C40 family peptidase [Paenisporosarcina indica]|uniref:C40 family peptidase n=1 Tax=Paenisporosarcina indica TaxID=650093 RepID=UPI00094F7866|nr:C40 family peptidase [Paenisporosarcina indica]